MKGFREIVRSHLDERLKRNLPALSESECMETCVVVAPHPDDETLGCGGVVCKKIAAGANVHFVFVTDGTASHSSLPVLDLKAMREREAIDAISQLGAGPDDVTFLEIPDGSARRHVDEIADRLVTLFNEFAPQGIFVPHALDPLADHEAVHQAVRRALDIRRFPVTVYEYPVWYWYHWPWVPIFGDRFGMWKKALRQSITTGFGTGSVSTLNTSALVAEFLVQKQAALSAHVSQVTKPEDEDKWPILAEVGGGEFLDRLMGDHEYFTRYKLYGRENG